MLSCCFSVRRYREGGVEVSAHLEPDFAGPKSEIRFYLFTRAELALGHSQEPI